MLSSEDEAIERIEYSKTNNKAKTVTENSTNGATFVEVITSSPYNNTISVSKANEKNYRIKFRQRFHVKKIQARKTRKTLEKYTGGLKTIKRLTQTIQKEVGTIRNDLKDCEIRIKTNNNQSKLIDEFDFFIAEQQLETDNEVAKKVVGYENSLVLFWPQSLNYVVESSEKKHFWKPSRSDPPLFAKIEANGPRYLSEEGIYVESLPSMTKSQRSMLEQRLMMENEKKWFSCEGNLKITKAPLEYALLRPNVSYLNIHMNNISQYVPAQFDMPQLEGVRIDEGNVLQIYVRYLKFQHHPLFSAQHVLQNRLIYYYTLFKREEDGNKIDRVTKRLNYLRNTKKNLENYLADADDDEYDIALQKMYKIIIEIYKLREKVLDERISRRRTVKNILETWKMLKHVRKIDGHISTPLRLIIKKEKRNYVQDKRDMDVEMKMLFYEIKYENDFLKRNRNILIKQSDDLDISVEEHLSFDEVKSKYEKCFREPGEPIVDFFIEYDQEITEVVENKNEKLRRTVIRGTKIFFKLLHNGIEICKSKIIEMDDNFFCDFDEKFVIITETISEPVTLELFEQSGNNTSKKKLYETNLTLPRLPTCKVMEISFENGQQVPRKYGGVGSGECVKKLFFEKYNLILEDLGLSTSGIMSYVVEWTIKGNVSYSSNTDYNVEQMLHPVNEAPSNKNDPQDPKNSKFDNFATGTLEKETYSHSEEYTKQFHYNYYLRPLTFCKNEAIKTNDRLTMLQLRDKNEPQFYGHRVPINEKEISKHTITNYKMRKNEKEVYASLIEKDNVTKPEGLAILREIYYQVFQKCRNTDINLSYDDVVNEQLVRQFENYLKQAINNTFNWLTLHSRLNLMPYNDMNFQKTSSRNETFFNIRAPLKIFVTIRSALDVPKRTRKYVHRDEHTENNSDDFYLRLCVVLKHSKNSKSVESGIINSSNPFWNETLVLEIETLNVDFMSPNFLSGSISLHLFDILNSEEKIWLGSTEINISSIYESDILEGVFRLETPTLLFGYEPEKRANIYPHISPIGLSLSIRAQPFMPRLHADMEKLQSNETPYLRNYILKWNERYNENFPRRKFSALAIDVYGRTSCVTRYITPIELPQLNPDNFQVTTQQLAKYISKFSFTDYNKYYQNIWLTAKQFLNIMVGSVVDHAVTLACCLQSLDLHVWLLLGYGTPNGSSAYVLTRESTSNSYAPTYYIFDVTTGTKYNILDSISPLQIIYCVINRKNVWANTQRTNKVTNTRFDFSKISDWLPLFTEEIVGPSISIQQRVAFRTLSNEQYLLQSKLEKKIHKKIAKLTNGETIKFCSSLSKTFKKHMLKFINGCFSDQPDFDIAQTILSVQFSHKQKMKGFLVCKTYTNVSSLLEFIDNTDLLKPLRADSEYILATQLVSWPNQIILWILIAVVY